MISFFIVLGTLVINCIVTSPAGGLTCISTANAVLNNLMISGGIELIFEAPILACYLKIYKEKQK